LLKKFIALILISLLFFSCSKKNSEDNPQKGIKQSKVKYSFEPTGLVSVYSEENSGFYKNQIYYLQYKGDTFGLKFTDYKGNIKKEIEFTRGNGPGQLKFIRSIKINNNRIYIYDSGVNTINIYDMNGNFIEEYQINDTIGSPWFIDVDDKYAYYTGLRKYRLGKIDFKTGSLNNSVKYAEIDMEFNENDMIKAGVIKVNDNNNMLYDIRYNSSEIKIYNKDLKLIDQIKFNFKKAYEPYHVIKLPDGDSWFMGDMKFTSISFDKNYIYLPFGGGYGLNRKELLWKGKTHPFRIFVFDINTGKYLYKIENKKIKKITGTVFIHGVTNQNIILYVEESGSLVKRLDPNREKRSIQNISIVVLNNPPYN